MKKNRLKKISCYFIFIIFICNLLSIPAFALERKTFYHNDALGSPVAMTDESGNVVWTQDYLPFGGEVNPTGPKPNAHKYTGKELDDETGLYYYGARFYDAKSGRFVSGDPVGGSLVNPQTWNRYIYVINNPYKFIDPDGKVAVTTSIAICVTSPACTALAIVTAKIVGDLAAETYKAVKNRNNIYAEGEDGQKEQTDASKGNEEGVRPDPDKIYVDKYGNERKFKPKKNWDGKPTRDGKYPSKDGTTWSKPTDHGGTHGKPHRDVTLPNGRHVTVQPKKIN